MDRPRIRFVEGATPFHIFRACRQAAERSGWTQAQVDRLMDTLARAPQHRLLQLVCDAFDVEQLPTLYYKKDVTPK